MPEFLWVLTLSLIDVKCDVSILTHKEVPMELSPVCFSRSSLEIIVGIFGTLVKVNDLDPCMVATLKDNPFVGTCVKLVAQNSVVGTRSNLFQILQSQFLVFGGLVKTGSYTALGNTVD